MLKIEEKDQAILLEALEDLMYKISLQLVEFKGTAKTKARKTLTQKQARIETLQHNISIVTSD